MLVYRVEHRFFRCGPYNNKPLEIELGWGDPRIQNLSEAVYRDVTDDGHPIPVDDGIVMDLENVCGFESMEQLLRWFSMESIDAMWEADYMLFVYSVPAEAVQRGGHQVMFPRDSELVDAIALDNPPFCMRE